MVFNTGICTGNSFDGCVAKYDIFGDAIHSQGGFKFTLSPN
jgi:hypothetical protein